MERDGKHKEEGDRSRASCEPTRFLQKPSPLMAVKMVLSLLRVDEMDVPEVPHKLSLRLQVKKRQLVSARNGGCSSGSSSSGGKNKKRRDPEAEVRELREELKRFKNAKKKQGVQCELAGEEGRFEEEGRMEVDEEAESKKKLD